LIDCRAVTDLKTFFAILSDRNIEKVIHSGKQDIELFYKLSGEMPGPVFDTQIGAAMAGLGAQCGYAQLAERLLDVSVEKTETLTDWSRRPLTKAQIAYAADDVRYLLPLYQQLHRRLVELGRWKWLQEELRRIERLVRSEPVVPKRAYLRVRGRGSLRGKGLAVLRELAEWREEVARTRQTARQYRARRDSGRDCPQGAHHRSGAARCVRCGRGSTGMQAWCARHPRVGSQERWPEPIPSPGPTPSTGVVELLQAVVRSRRKSAHCRACSRRMRICNCWRNATPTVTLLIF
jgi:ribonuclease D